MQESEENPWKVTGETKIYENPWISLTQYEVINPAGNPGIYGKVHFKTLAIGVIPLDEEMNTWLVGQYRFAPGQYSWEIPEGGGATDIPPVESARRELLEETGLRAERWLEIQQIHLSNSVTDEFGLIFLARGLTQFEPEPEETEQLQVRKLPFAEAYNMVCDGRITDSLSVAAILKVRLMQLENLL